jgi:hypothetical protein
MIVNKIMQADAPSIDYIVITILLIYPIYIISKVLLKYLDN